MHSNTRIIGSRVDIIKSGFSLRPNSINQRYYRYTICRLNPIAIFVALCSGLVRSVADSLVDGSTWGRNDYYTEEIRNDLFIK